jgi:uncharacterized membrane protein
VVLAVVLLNDAALALLLDVAVPAWTVVVAGTVVATAAVYAVVVVTVEDDDLLTRRELQREVASLRERVAELEE